MYNENHIILAWHHRMWKGEGIAKGKQGNHQELTREVRHQNLGAHSPSSVMTSMTYWLSHCIWFGGTKRPSGAKDWPQWTKDWPQWDNHQICGYIRPVCHDICPTAYKPLTPPGGGYSFPTLFRQGYHQNHGYRQKWGIGIRSGFDRVLTTSLQHPYTFWPGIARPNFPAFLRYGAVPSMLSQTIQLQVDWEGFMTKHKCPKSLPLSSQELA